MSKNLIIFSPQPTKTMEIYLPKTSSPGLGHILMSMSGIMSFCYYKEYVPYLTDNDWYYGRWTDYFEPFCEDEYKINLLSQKLSNTTIDIGIGTTCPHTNALYGMMYLLFNSTMTLYKKFFQQIYRPKKKFILTDEYKNIDLAIHVRQGDHFWKQPMTLVLRKFKDIKDITNPKKLFIMTDQADVVVQFREKFPDLEIITLCPDKYDGDPNHIRSMTDLNLLIKEIEIAKHAKYFVGSAFSQTSTIVDLYRQEKNVFYI